MRHPSRKVPWSLGWTQPQSSGEKHRSSEPSRSIELMGDPSWPLHLTQPGGGKENPGESLCITGGWAEFGGIVLPPTTLSEGEGLS